MAYIPGDYDHYNSFTSNRVTAGLATNLIFGNEEAIEHPGLVHSATWDIYTPFLGVYPRLPNYAVILPPHRQSVVDMASGV